ncbi:hypothetical protein Cgig2_007070 [Carnegiea gigantea]|uniref:Uncharacterized protein n=1 Tax=Carnegiea gigantea TaxID=171969 RepID=A0A9Q1KA18_9CARY|nr:hypothetical protein Cgig2_007070 [Carnegiea gigantea]
MRNVYTSHKRSTKASSTTSKEQEVEDIWVATTEANKERTTVMVVVVPVVAAGSPDDGVGGINGTLGHSEEELLTKTKPRTERTTAAESSPNGAAGDAPIHQWAQSTSRRSPSQRGPLTPRPPLTVRAPHYSGMMLSLSHAVPQHGVPLSHSSIVPNCGTSCLYPYPPTCGGLPGMEDGSRWTMLSSEPTRLRKLPQLVAYIQNIVEDNHRISYSVPRHTMTDAMTSTYAVYHNHECGVPGYAVQV